MPRSEDHWEERPAHLYLPSQIHSIHDAGKPNVSEDHGDLSAVRKHSCKRCFCAFIDAVEFAIFKHCRREFAQYRVILDNQHRSTRLVHICTPSLTAVGRATERRIRTERAGLRKLHHQATWGRTAHPLVARRVSST